MKRRTYRRLAVIAAVSLLAVLLTACGKNAAADTPAMPPPAVEVTAVVQEDVPVTSEWVATIDGSVNAIIQPQVMGYLVRQLYQEGSHVQKGQALFEIDPRPFQAVVDQAAAQLAQAESQVVQAHSQVEQAESQIVLAQAQARKAQLDVQRDTPLAKARAIAQSQLDTEVQAQAAAEAAVQSARANLSTSKAAVTTAQAAVTAARAALAQAQLNLGFTQVRSLVDGVAGVAQTQIGNLVKNDTTLTTVSQVDPLRVYFPISEQEYLKLASGKQGGLFHRTEAPALELVLSDGTVFPHKGRVSFADRQVDSQTGTIRIAASFPNPGNVLRPGQFGRVRAVTGTRMGALLVPQRSVAEVQGHHNVAIVGAGNKVEIRPVEVGPTSGSRYVIESGLKPGESVIVEGLAKAMPGAPVDPHPSTEKH